ncbi:MAG TPA: radical SAM protein [Sorangium sp.]|nr:radical SAM protein [Sorangium sp.]
MRQPAAVVLVSCYELGRQPFNLASPWAQLEAAGFDVVGIDVAVEPLPDDIARGAQLVAISVPMHTALRLSMTVAQQLRQQAPEAHFCFYGLYAALNEQHLLAGCADSVVGGEFEQVLLALAQALAAGTPPQQVAGLAVAGHAGGGEGGGERAHGVLQKLTFMLPQRAGLPSLERYATFFGPSEGEVRKVGYVEASRGCLHVCRHCPITPVYQGRFFVVPKALVLADAEQQIGAGARHITFGDPDFFNGPGHSMAIARALHQRHPDVSFDVTIKVQHLLRYPQHLAELSQLGCAFVVSAVESLSDEVLSKLDKGHNREDISAALKLCRTLALTLRPTLVAFTPWTRLDDYVALLEWIIAEGLIDAIEPIQLAIRLLIPPGSALLHSEGDASWLGPLSLDDFGYRWTHPDARMDDLQRQVANIVEAAANEDWGAVVLRVREAAYQALQQPAPAVALHHRGFVPRLSEAWFCCAEPSHWQLQRLQPSCGG